MTTEERESIIAAAYREYETDGPIAKKVIGVAKYVERKNEPKRSHTGHAISE